jgi:hypothetical protein
MSKAWRTYAFLLVIACGGDRAPGKDTALVDELPPDDSASPPRVSTWNRAAGEFFAVRSDSAGQSFVVNPAYGDAQALDTLTAAEWNVEGSSLVLFDGAKIVGTARITGFHYDSTCAGWPTATLVSETAASASWRIAFPEGRVQGLPFDSLPALTSADSAERARTGALAASRLADDTLTAFRGRPFAVRQAHRVTIATCRRLPPARSGRGRKDGLHRVAGSVARPLERKDSPAHPTRARSRTHFRMDRADAARHVGRPLAQRDRQLLG